MKAFWHWWYIIYETRKRELFFTCHFPVNYSRAVYRFGAPIDRILYRRLKFFCVVDRSVSRTCHATTFFKFRILWNYFNIISRTLVIYLRSYILLKLWPFSCIYSNLLMLIQLVSYWLGSTQQLIRDEILSSWMKTKWFYPYRHNWIVT